MIRRIAITALASIAFDLGLAQLVSATELAPPPPHAPKAVRQAKTAPPEPAPAPAASPNYTGFYAGLNGGGGFENTINNGVTSCSSVFFVWCSLVPGQLNTRPSGFIGGGQIGYNWQSGLYVWGVETDFQGADIRGSATVTNYSTAFPADSVTAAGSQKIDWFGTFRGRLGWTPTPPLLIYATGGLAYGQVKTNVSFAGAGTGVFGASAVAKTDTRAGWTVGGGAEWMFAPQWSIKAEYLYYDLGTDSVDQTLNLYFGGPLLGSVGIHSAAHYHGNIVRGGVNFKFY
jgi:outer membrane immunogenic protein